MHWAFAPAPTPKLTMANRQSLPITAIKVFFIVVPHCCDARMFRATRYFRALNILAQKLWRDLLSLQHPLDLIRNSAKGSE
jgi:hypothetical protein